MLSGILLFQVSISLSSGFSFQGQPQHINVKRAITFQSRYRAASHFRMRSALSPMTARFGFNLVIERLLISGITARLLMKCMLPVSISLSSGFSFQVTGSESYFDSSLYPFQSRYRAASHFRLLAKAKQRIFVVL